MLAAPMSEVTIFGIPADVDDPDCVGSVAIPVRDHIAAATTTSLMHTNWGFAPPGKYVHRSLIQGSILPMQRNMAVQRMKGDWLVFIDDDMVWARDDLARLVAAREEIDADILGGLCFRRAEPHESTMYMREQPTAGGYVPLEDWDKDIVEVDATGMAFVIIHKRVFEKIAGTPQPPLKDRMAMNPPNFFRWSGIKGEDLQFCEDAKQAGCRVFVDTRIEIGHISEIEVRRKHSLLQLLTRPDDVTAERRRVNDSMGLPTLSREQILERLA